MEYVVVFGCPRSGTTYLQKMLAGLRNTEAKIGNFVPVVVPHLVNQHLSAQKYEALCGSVQRAIDVYLAGDYNSRFRALEYWWAAPAQRRRLKHVVRKGPRPRPEVFVYKEPFFSLAPEFVLDALPEAKIIYVYRDGRDVANSLVSSYEVFTDQKLTHLRTAEMRMGRPYDHRYVPWWVEEGRDQAFIQSSPYVRSIWMWTYMVERCRNCFEDLDADTSSRVLQVRYERLMAHPDRTGDRILTHLGAEGTPAFQRQLGKARTTSIGKHRQRSGEEIEAAEQIAYKPLEELAYL